ncbi:MAG: hypothetical protein M1819_007485 [Sarea resinae]|nr:MAG: hypothetical protein M1819_007485 [Sarea resinae]
MHAGLLQNGRVVFLDKVENFTQLKLSDGQFAYSSEYDPATNQAVALAYKTNAFCSGGAFLADGRFISVGGNAPLPDVDPTVGDGFDAIRYLSRSTTDASLDGQEWSEPGNKLASARWYASAQILLDGSVFVASGSLNGLDPTVPANNNPTYEILSAEGITNGVNVPMDILVKNQPYYMYPFLHLLPDNSLFVFVSKSAELFDVSTNATIRTLPDLPGDYRTYPNTGTSVLLPLSSANSWNPEVVICGGGAYQDITSPTDPSCGRIQPLAADASWEMDSMPQGRGMVESVLLPDGTVVFLNGANLGAQGFGLATDPTLEPLIYDPTQPLGQRFSSGTPSTIPRLYHSVALLLLDGTILVAGSNPVQQPILTPSAANPYVTEFRVEICESFFFPWGVSLSTALIPCLSPLPLYSFLMSTNSPDEAKPDTPPYLSLPLATARPTNITLSSTSLTLTTTFTISFSASPTAQNVTISLYHGGFVTHSLHMNQRMIILDHTGWVPGQAVQELEVAMPGIMGTDAPEALVPPGPYVVWVVVDGVPGNGTFVSVG